MLVKEATGAYVLNHRHNRASIYCVKIKSSNVIFIVWFYLINARMGLILINRIFRRSDIFPKSYFRGNRDKEIIENFWHSRGVWYCFIIVLKDDAASILKFLVWHKRWDSAPKPLVMLLTVSDKAVSQRLFSNTNYQISMALFSFQNLFLAILRAKCASLSCVHVGHRSFFSFMICYFDRSMVIDNISNRRTIKL